MSSPNSTAQTHAGKVKDLVVGRLPPSKEAPAFGERRADSLKAHLNNQKSSKEHRDSSCATWISSYGDSRHSAGPTNPHHDLQHHKYQTLICIKSKPKVLPSHTVLPLGREVLCQNCTMPITLTPGMELKMTHSFQIQNTRKQNITSLLIPCRGHTVQGPRRQGHDFRKELICTTACTLPNQYPDSCRNKLCK